MSSSRSSRSKSKESSLTSRVKLLAKETNGTDDDTEEDPININSEGSSEESSSNNEKVKKKHDSSLNKSGFSMTTEMKKLLERVLCCSCGKQLNPMNPGAVKRHPWLKVVTCKKCYKFLRSGPFTRDADGIDEQCRWCGDGGRLYGCDYCHNCFCRSCIKRNLGRSEASMMESEDDSKWHCYLCKPKKLKKLTDDCDKILGFIKAQEKKEREREEREKAKQKEKEKREKLKKEEKNEEKNEEKEKDLKDVKTTPKRGFPAPKDKSEIKTEKSKVEKSEESSMSEKKVETSKASNSTPDVILVGGNSEEVDNPHHRAVKYKPDIRTGVQHVQKISSNLTAVTVGPKYDKPVVVPNITKGGNFQSNIQRQIQPKPLLAGMLTQGITGSNISLGRSLKKITPMNDLRAMKINIMPHNVENIAEKLSPIAQSLNLTLNSIKTDIAIAKLSQSNMFQAKQLASSQMKNGLEYFFNSVRELLNVQLLAKNPNDVADDKGQGDVKTLSGQFITSTPNCKQENQVNTTPKKLDESVIPIEIDPSPVKKVEEMETGEDVYVVTDNDSKDVKILHVSDDKVVKEENLIKSEISKKDEVVLNDDAPSVKDSKSDNTKPLEDDKDLDSLKEAEQALGSKTSEKAKDSIATSEIEVQEISDSELDEKASKKSKSKLDMSENTAAELELLKEMADELNEQEEKSKELDQPRKSSRKKNIDYTEDKDESDRDSSVRRSSRQRQKPEEVNTEKTGKRNDNSPEKGKTDSKKTGKKKDEVSDEQEKRSKRKSGNRSKVMDDSEDQTEDESDEKEEAKDKDKSKVLPKKQTKSGDSKVSSDVTDENTEENTEEEEGGLDEEAKIKSSAKSSKKSSEKQKTKSRDRSKSAEESCEEVEDKKKKKSEKGNKKESKKSTKEEKSDNYDKALEDQVPTDQSDTTESSDDSVEEFGKRKKKKKATVKQERETSKRPTRQSDRGKKSENNTENSDSDPNFDSDLEKEIKSLSRSTRLKKKEKGSKDSEKEDKGKKKKSREKEGKKGKKSVKEDVSDLSSDAEDVPEVKSSKRSTRQTCNKKSENTTENSDSDPEFDSDLEKDIKSLSKGTRLSRSKAKETKESKESKKEESKVKEEKSKKGGKKEKKAVKEEDDSDLSSDEDEIPEDDEETEDDNDDNLSASQIKKLKQASKAMMEAESDDDDRPDDLSSDSTDDHEVSFPKLTTPKKGKKKELDDVSEDSDFMTPKKKRKRGVIKDKLLDVNISGSDSDTKKKGKGKKGKRKRKKEADSDAFSELSDEEENRKKGKKRRRIKKLASSDEEVQLSNDEFSEMDEDGTPSKHGRKQIRKVIGSKKLTGETRKAQKAEEERRKRIEERQKEYNSYVEVEGGEEEEEEVPEGTEREMTTPTKATDSIAKILGSPRKVPVTTKCVLEMDKETKKILIEVDRTLIRKLKPHQVEAVRFIYNCCVESVSRIKKEKGAGCILAHCMGLGKTLSVITFVHTMLSNVKLTNMSKCLVVCPLNTTLNWVNEFEIWLDDVDFEIEVYEMSKVKQNFERAQMLKEWHEGGAGVMILGYDMYRNLVNGSHCKNKKQKKVFYETLADPGPDLVVCDEGHILKNDATSLSKAMTKINSMRRIVLTGTPLQNNLGEYHCMVDFVKPSLLGTRKEFNNRFCNPITNGQCSDSTPFDVKLMKHRSHILHELLAGCVQRKDYSALTKYLPPKFEYVISVRLSEVQMTMYEKYLDMNVGSGEIKGKGARLFSDYQALMRIWTHPWVLKLDEIRQENKRMFDDDDDSFIDDSGSDEDSFIDDSTTSPSSEEDESANEKKKKKKKKKTRGDKGSSSSDEDSKKENGDEVVKKWTSKRRGNEEGAGSSWMEEMGYSTGPKEVSSEWWSEFVKEEDEFRLELSGKMTLMFEILKMCEDIGDKVLVFSQSLLSLDIIEDFLSKIDEANNPINEANDANKPSTSGESSTGTSKENGVEKTEEEKKGEEKKGEEQKGEEKTQEEKNKDKFSQYGKSWSKGLDYFRMDGSTNSQNRKASQDMFNDPENYRARLFLISTKAGSLGINLVSANRVIIFDASWNPSHDIQSIFRVYRFGQVKPVYVYRFLAQGTMEEKIYERQVTKQSLSQRVVDEHQIERHFTSSDLQELYKFQPDRLNDPEKKSRPLPMLPKDHMLAELMTNNKEWIVTYHEHDSLLENVTSQELTEDEKKAAWEDYEDEKKGISKAMGGMQMNPALLATQQMNMQTLLMQGQANLGQAAVLQIVQDLKTRFPNLPPEVFQQRVQAVLRQVLTQQIMQQSDIQRRQLEQHRMNELNRLNQIKQQIQRQQAMIDNQQRVYSMGTNPGLAPNMGMQSLMPQGLRPQTLNQLQMRGSAMNTNLNNDQQKK